MLQSLRAAAGAYREDSFNCARAARLRESVPDQVLAWTKRLAPYHVTVRNCRLEGLYAAVSTVVRLPSHGTPRTTPIRGILFDGLDICSCEEGFSFRNAGDVTLRRIKMTDVRKPWFADACGEITCDDGSFHVPQ